MTVKKGPSGPGMKSLTSCQVNRGRVEEENGEKRSSWTWHETNHILSNQ